MSKYANIIPIDHIQLFFILINFVFMLYPYKKIECKTNLLISHSFIEEISENGKSLSTQIPFFFPIFL